MAISLMISRMDKSALKMDGKQYIPKIKENKDRLKNILVQQIEAWMGPLIKLVLNLKMEKAGLQQGRLLLRKQFNP